MPEPRSEARLTDQDLDDMEVVGIECNGLGLDECRRLIAEVRRLREKYEPDAEPDPTADFTQHARDQMNPPT